MLAPAERLKDAEIKARGQKPADVEVEGQRAADTEVECQRSEGQRGPEFKSRGLRPAGSGPELKEK